MDVYDDPWAEEEDEEFEAGQRTVGRITALLAELSQVSAYGGQACRLANQAGWARRGAAADGAAATRAVSSP